MLGRGGGEARDVGEKCRGLVRDPRKRDRTLRRRRHDCWAGWWDGPKRGTAVLGPSVGGSSHSVGRSP